MADPWEQSDFKPDLTDRQLPSIRVRTKKLTVVEVPDDPRPLSDVPAFCRELKVKAGRGNTGLVYIGDPGTADLTVTGYPLDAGEELSLPVNNLKLIYYQGDTVNDVLHVIYFS